MSRKALHFSLEKLHRPEVISQMKKSRKQIIEYNKGAQNMAVYQGWKPTGKKNSQIKNKCVNICYLQKHVHLDYRSS